MDVNPSLVAPDAAPAQCMATVVDYFEKNGIDPGLTIAQREFARMDIMEVYQLLESAPADLDPTLVSVFRAELEKVYLTLGGGNSTP